MVRFCRLYPDLENKEAARDEFEFKQKRLQHNGFVTQFNCRDFSSHESFSPVVLKVPLGTITFLTRICFMVYSD